MQPWARQPQHFHSPNFHSPKPLDQSQPLPDCNLTKGTLFRSSLGALDGVLIAVESGCRGVGDTSAGIFAPQSWNDFPCGSTPSGPMVTWMAEADSAHQIGLQSTLYAVLIAVEISLT